MNTILVDFHDLKSVKKKRDFVNILFAKTCPCCQTVYTLAHGTVYEENFWFDCPKCGDSMIVLKGKFEVLRWDHEQTNE